MARASGPSVGYGERHEELLLCLVDVVGHARPGALSVAGGDRGEDPPVVLDGARDDGLKDPEPGGVWCANPYPGAGVDTPSHLYSFFFARNDWSRHFELQVELQRYLARVLGEVVDPARVRHGTEVLRADWDERQRLWRLQLRGPDGSLETVSANVVISGVGSINRAQLPDVPGVEEFEGVHVHSSAWPADLDLAGKRVALVGTGASSMQIGPAIAGEVGQLTVFQRSPVWIAPFEKFGKPIAPELADLLSACPLYHAWYWARLFWQFGDKVIDALRIDPDWEYPDRSVNARNDGHREFFTRYLTDQLAGRPDLIEKTLPHYPPPDEMHAETVWTHPGMRTYYRNSKGRVVFMIPFLNVEYWEMTRAADMENYEEV